MSESLLWRNWIIGVISTCDMHHREVREAIQVDVSIGLGFTVVARKARSYKSGAMGNKKRNSRAATTDNHLLFCYGVAVACVDDVECVAGNLRSKAVRAHATGDCRPR